MKHQQRSGTTQPPGESHRLEQHPHKTPQRSAYFAPSAPAAPPVEPSAPSCARTWRETQMGARFARRNSGLCATGRRPAKNGASGGFGVRRRRAGNGTCRRIRIAIFGRPARSDSSAGPRRPEEALPGPDRQRTLEGGLRVRFLSAGQSKVLPHCLLEAPLPTERALQITTPAGRVRVPNSSAIAPDLGLLREQQADSQAQSLPPVRKPRGSRSAIPPKCIARFALEQACQPAAKSSY